MATTQVILLDAVVENLASSEIQVYASSSIQDVVEQFGVSVTTTNEFGTPIVYSVVSPETIVSTATFGTSQLNTFLTLQSIQSTVQFGDSQPQLQIVILEDTDIDSTLAFGTSSVNLSIKPNSIQNAEAFGTHKLISKIIPDAIESTLEFGNLKTVMQITNVPLPGIESTVEIPNPNVVKVIGPLSINSTESFGINNIIDNIHRLLVYKDDNLSKVGENDAVVIAGGIRMNPSSTVANTAASGEAELPQAPVGFISININGTDYKVPYYNS